MAFMVIPEVNLSKRTHANWPTVCVWVRPVWRMAQIELRIRLPPSLSPKVWLLFIIFPLFGIFRECQNWCGKSAGSRSVWNNPIYRSATRHSVGVPRWHRASKLSTRGISRTPYRDLPLITINGPICHVRTHRHTCPYVPSLSLFGLCQSSVRVCVCAPTCQLITN